METKNHCSSLKDKKKNGSSVAVVDSKQDSPQNGSQQLLEMVLSPNLPLTPSFSQQQQHQPEHHATAELPTPSTALTAPNSPPLSQQQQQQEQQHDQHISVLDFFRNQNELIMQQNQIIYDLLKQ